MRIDIPVSWGSYEILQALAQQARSYACIGVQEGDCLMHVLRGNPAIDQLALCDTWGPHYGGTNRGSHEHVQRKLDALPWRGSVTWLDGDSKSLIPTLTGKWDLTYVDGDHSEAGALTDFRNMWPRTAGAMVCHDIRMPSVWAALTRFLDAEASLRASIAMGGFGSAIVHRAEGA